jgi:ketosteroid isomerase-like protein
VDRAGVAAWLAAYERAWRTPGTEVLADLFAPDVTYSYDPYEEPVRGLDALGPWWDEGRDGPDEVFTMTTEVVALDGDVAVARAEVAYGEPVRQEYRDLWVVRFGADGRCRAFEEWPFWPGHGRSPASDA